jgi:hypothetical protein
VTRPRRTATFISSAGLRHDWLQFSSTQAPQARAADPAVDGGRGDALVLDVPVVRYDWRW